MAAATGETEIQIIDAMKAHSFTASEAKAYVALLKGHPATGYELAARSGVPRSAIYSVLRRLDGLGLINEIQQKPAKFVPLTPDRLFDLLESRFSRNLDQLRDSLTSLDAPDADASTWTLRGYSAMLAQAETLIRNAKSTVHASMWRREALTLEPALRRALERDIDVVVFSFNALPEGLGHTYCYGIEESELEPHWQHKIICITDHGHLLVGGAEQNEHTRSVATDEPNLVEMAISNLVLDVTLLGERTGTDVGPAVSRLTQHLAPVDELIERSLSIPG